MVKYMLWVEPFVIDIADDDALDPDDIHREAYQNLKDTLNDGDYRCVRVG